MRSLDHRTPSARPIIFSAPMIQALLAGRKTQTRRLLPAAPRPLRFAVGDRLYVREACGIIDGFAEYRAGHEEARAPGPRVDVRWRPSIHMPRWASRLTLGVTAVRVQALQEISEEDAQAEGARPAFSWPGHEFVYSTPRYVWGFHELWNSIHGARAWDANPVVVAVTFTVEQRNIDHA